MKVQINGEPREVPDAPTVRELVESLGFQGRAVAVEINKLLVPKKQHEATRVKEGDVIEVVTLVGGG